MEQHERHRLQRHELHTERHFWLDGSHAAGHDDLFDHLCRCGRRVARGKRDGDGQASPPPPAPTATLSASPTSINAGQSSTLTWSSTNATGCSGTNFTPNATSGSMAVTPPATTIYSITCAGAGGMSPAASAR